MAPSIVPTVGMDSGKTAIKILLSLVLGVTTFFLWSQTSFGHQIIFQQSALLRQDIATIAIVPNTFAKLRLYLFAYSVKQALFWSKLLSPFVLSASFLILAASSLFFTEE